MPDGDHEVGAGEDHDLAGLHHLAGGGEFGVLDVADGLEDREQHLVVLLHFGPLMRVYGVLDRQRMQAEQLGESGEFLLRRLVQTDPDEAVARLTGLPQCLLDGAVAVLLPLAVEIDHAVDHGAAERRPDGVAEVHGRRVGSANCLAEVADHRHGGLLRRIDGQCAIGRRA